MGIARAWATNTNSGPTGGGSNNTLTAIQGTD